MTAEESLLEDSDQDDTHRSPSPVYQEGGAEPMEATASGVSPPAKSPGLQVVTGYSAPPAPSATAGRSTGRPSRQSPPGRRSRSGSRPSSQHREPLPVAARQAVQRGLRDLRNDPKPLRSDITFPTVATGYRLWLPGHKTLKVDWKESTNRHVYLMPESRADNEHARKTCQIKGWSDALTYP